jgi:hypothetical protein
MIQIEYESIKKKGTNNNPYYDQTAEQRKQLTQCIVAIITRFSERTQGFTNIKDWKKYNSELGEEVIWATGKYNHNPSVRCLWAELIKTTMKEYQEMPARYSVRQIDNFNRTIKIATKLYNDYTVDVKKEKATDYQIEMMAAAQGTTNTVLDKFIQYQY